MNITFYWTLALINSRVTPFSHSMLFALNSILILCF